MSMIKIGSGRDENRSPLYKVVPLDIPFSIGIWVSDFCNFKCVYCSHSTNSKVCVEHMITWDEFVNMIDNIEELYRINGGGRAKNLVICGVGEPLTNPLLPKMIRYCREHNISDRIELTTNGSLLTHKLSDELIDAGLTRILVSIQGINAEAYNRISGINIDFEKFLNEIKYFYENRKQCTVYIKTLDIALNKGEDEEFYNIFSPIADMVNIEKAMVGFDDVDYSKLIKAKEDRCVTRYGYKWKERIACDALFMRLNITTHGDVNACTCQWPALSLGNIYDKPLKDIWNGDLHKLYMKLHLQGKRGDIKRCANCESISYAGHPLDNLDDHLDEILDRLNKM